MRGLDLGGFSSSIGRLSSGLPLGQGVQMPGLFPGNTSLTFNRAAGGRAGGSVDDGAGFAINYEGPGLNFGSFHGVDWPFQGLCYAPPYDRWFVAEIPETGTTIIHEMSGDGTATGASFQMPDGSPTPNKVQSLSWHDGYLWSVEANPAKVYQIDWEAKQVLGSYRIGKTVVNSGTPIANTFVPTSSGDVKHLVSIWGDGEPRAYLIDYENAIKDGTASGNVFRELVDDVDAGRIQGMLYHGGALYVNTDNCYNGDTTGFGSYVTFKIVFPYADLFENGAPLIGDRYLWWWPHAHLDYSTPIQDIGYNPTTGVFWTPIESGTTGLYDLYGGFEGYPETLPFDWQMWRSSSVGGPGFRRSIHVDSAENTGTHSQEIFLTEQPADVEVWFFDDRETSKSVTVAVAQSQYPENAKHALGVNTDYSSSEFMGYNTTDGWHTTGISRPESAQWMKFRWELDGSATSTAISRDGGETWTAAGSYTSDATALGILQLQAGSGQAHVGPFSISPR